MIFPPAMPIISQAFADHPRFRMVPGDVTQPPAERFDAIADLACPASPRHYQADPVRTTRRPMLLEPGQPARPACLL